MSLYVHSLTAVLTSINCFLIRRSECSCWASCHAFTRMARVICTTICRQHLSAIHLLYTRSGFVGMPRLVALQLKSSRALAVAYAVLYKYVLRSGKPSGSSVVGMTMCMTKLSARLFFRDGVMFAADEQRGVHRGHAASCAEGLAGIHVRLPFRHRAWHGA